MKKRMFALLLVFVMILGLMPTAAFAASVDVTGGKLVAEFTPAEIQRSASATSYTTTLEFQYDSSNIVTGAVVSMDWSRLGAKVDSVEFYAPRNTTLTVKTEGNGDNSSEYTLDDPTGFITDATWYATDNKSGASRGALVSAEFTLNGSIPAGTYEVPVSVSRLERQQGANLTKYLTKTESLVAVLTVKNEDGSVPVDSRHNIDIAIVESGGTTAGNMGTVKLSGSADYGSFWAENKCKDGYHVFPLVEAATGYEVVSVTVKDANGNDVAFNKSSYSTATVVKGDFVMPKADVLITATFKAKTSSEGGQGNETAYNLILTSNDSDAGRTSMNKVATAKEGDTVSVYAWPNNGYKIDSIVVNGSNDITVTDTGNIFTIDGVDYKVFQFKMPATAANIKVTFLKTDGQNQDKDVTQNMLSIQGTVRSARTHNVLPGAKVTLHCEDGSIADKVVETDSNGMYNFGEVPSSYKYTVQAEYDTCVHEGKAVEKGKGGDICHADSVAVSRSSTNTTSPYYGESINKTLDITLAYTWNCDNQDGVETIYAGLNDKFLDTDDYYEKMVDGKTVRVFSQSEGDENMRYTNALHGNENCYYDWQVTKSTSVDDKQHVYLGASGYAGGPGNYYYVNVNPTGANVDGEKLGMANMQVLIAGDGIPATPDDYYVADVNHDETAETVIAGADGIIPSESNYYVSKEQTVHVGKDITAGTPDDFYLLDADGHDGAETIFVGSDRVLGTADDYYERDVDGDSRLERIYAGENSTATNGTGIFNKASDFYWAEISYDQNAPHIYNYDAAGETATLVKVHPGATNDPADPFEFGQVTDYYSYSVNTGEGKTTKDATTIRVGADKKAGTPDDEYDAKVLLADNGVAGNTYVPVVVFAGKNGIPGTADDFYKFDADIDANDVEPQETVFIGDGAIVGDANDYYEKNVNGKDDIETVYAGADNAFNTNDDYYVGKVGGKDVDVIAAGDHKIGTANDEYQWAPINGSNTETPVRVGEDRYPGTNDDEYDATISLFDISTAKGESANVIVYAGDPTQKDDIAGGDKVPGTPDDRYYLNAAAVDDAKELVYIGSDAKVGTAEDYILKNVNGVDGDEKIFAGEDTKFNTNDDNYADTVNGNPVTVYAGTTAQKDGKPVGDSLIGTKDDIYVPYTIGGKAVEVRVGDDLKAGTPGDEYDFVVTYKEDPATGAKGTTVITVISTGDHPGIANASDDAAKAGDYYMLDADGDGHEEKVFVGKDGIPGTPDDFYEKEVNGKTGDERVFAGADGGFCTQDDHYFDNVTIGDPAKARDIDVIAGKDCRIGTSDDYYDTDADHEAGNERVFVGNDRHAGTENDYYIKDVNGDSKNETVFAGKDKTFPTSEDNYTGHVPYSSSKSEDEVTVFAGEDNTIGTEKDWYAEDIDGDGQDETKVFVGGDKKAGTQDDYYDATVGTQAVKVRGCDQFETSPSADGKLGDGDDVYKYDLDGDGTQETIVYVGSDNKPGTKGNDTDTPTDADDYYLVDVDGDGVKEKVYVGKDGVPGTKDDYYVGHAPLLNEDGTKNTNPDDAHPVYAGDDKKIGTDDDYYNADPDKDNETEQVFAGKDGKSGTADDWYPHDVDGDGTDEHIFAGPDGKAGTSDDVYPFDYNNDDKIDGFDGKDLTGDEPVDSDDREIVHVGPDGVPGTDDDYYKTDADNDPTTPKDDDGNTKDNGKETVHVGPDGKPGTNDDFYQKDVDGDGEDDDINSGDKDHKGDETIGSPDDYYKKDVDGDGEDETVYVGPDGKPGTDDDWYYATIKFNANGGTLNGKAAILSADLTAFPTASKSNHRFNGFTTAANSGSIVKLADYQNLKFLVKDKKADPTLYASFTYITPSYGGGGGGGGGAPAPTTYTVKFETNGGSKIADATGVRSGNTVTKPADPTKEGFTFTGWFTDKELTKAYDFTSKVTSSFTLYAGWEKSGKTVSDNVFGLLTSDHIAYIAGYGDGNFGPNDNLTRAQAAMIFYRLLNADAHKKYDTTKETFDDIDGTEWYAKAVATMQNAGIMVGYGDNKFGPNDLITRAQFATVCARIGQLKAEGKATFTDVPADSWAFKYIQAAAENKWVVGYGDGKFGPNDNITRAQAVAILNRVLLRNGITEAGLAKGYKNFSDNQNAKAWFYLDIIEAANAHDFEKNDKGVETWTGLRK